MRFHRFTPRRQPGAQDTMGRLLTVGSRSPETARTISLNRRAHALTRLPFFWGDEWGLLSPHVMCVCRSAGRVQVRLARRAEERVTRAAEKAAKDERKKQEDLKSYKHIMKVGHHVFMSPCGCRNRHK